MVAKCIRIVVVCCLWLSMIAQAVPALAQSEPAGGYVDYAGGSDTHLDVALHADRAPTINEVATLTLMATPRINVPELVLEWSVPDGVELLGGPTTEASGAVAAGETVAQVRQIRFAGPGVYKVMAEAGFRLGEAMSFSALAVLFFTVNADGSATASTIDPNARNFDRTVETEVLPGVTTAALHAPNGDPCFAISGRITRWDYPPTTAPGYGTPVEVPLRHVNIVVREQDTVFDDSYGGGNTDADGRFSFNFCDDDGVFDDTLEIYIRIHAEIDFNGSDVVSVEDDGIIDDRWEFNSEVQSSEGGALTFNLRMKDNEQSAIMNIADATFDAWRVWNDNGGAKGDDAIFDGEAEVHYEPGDGVENSYYSGYFLFGSNVFNYDDISIADAASDPDPWDDSVIIHEWGHMADDYYGCDDNGGGDHFVNQLADDLELTWGEGYPDYYQSAVRSITGQPNAGWYLDVNGNGGGIAVDLENYDQTVGANLLSEFNEMAIAAMLYDLFDNNNDARTPGPPAGGPFDSVAHGHRMIQEVYTDPFFESNGDFFDDTCTSFVYLWSWLKLGKPTDSATAEAVTKNNGRSNPFFGGRSLAAIASALQLDGAAMPNAGMPNAGMTSLAATDNSNPNQIDHRWWKRLVLVADNSASMAESDKFGAVKTVMKESVNDALNANPSGIEVGVYAFNNTSGFIQPVIQGQFRAEGIYPFIDQMATVNAADPGCLGSIDALSALRQAANAQTRGQLWLYTDTDTSLLPGQQGLIRTQLNQQQLRASIALLGGCGSSGQRQSDLTGEQEDFLMLAADGSQSSGIVPYLLMALGTGGQFLYVNANQLGDAADILRAQLANSAGAGKWSDYVSDVFTYRWDRLEPREYLWIGGLGGGIPLPFENPVVVDLPGEFSFYGEPTGEVEVFEDGYLWMNPCHDTPQLPLCLVGFEQYANILHKDLEWGFDANPNLTAQGNSPDAPDAGPKVHVYYGNYQEWYVISTEGTAIYSGNQEAFRAYQVWLNMQTGEMRYLYGQVRDEDTGSAEISVRQNLLFGGPNQVLVSNQDLAGAVSGSGYKFTPAPPIPTRTYAVKADSLIERIGFLQTGYSGAFELMVVTDPNGAAVSCGGEVTCYTVDHLAGDRMVQYVEVPNSGPGTWHATIDASSAQATFSFNALAASDLSADSPSKRLLPSIGPSALVVQLGRTVDNNTLTGWFQSPNGQRFSADFTLYDDGEHGDGRAGDGRFGVLDLAAPGRGVGYLWVKGQVGGEDVERADPVPFNFQPLRVTALTTEVSNNNEAVALSFHVHNLDSRALCFNPVVTLPAGWSGVWNFAGCQGISANSSQIYVLTVTPNWPDAPSGQIEEVGVAFVEAGEGAIQGSDGTTFVRRRPPASVTFDRRAELYEIRPDANTPIPIILRAADEQGYPVADGTLVEVSVDQGTIAPVATQATVAAASDQATVELTNGRVELLFTPPTNEGDVTATATLGALTDSMTLHVVRAAADSIDLAATPTELFEGPTSSALVVTVQDAWGDPVEGALVRVGVSDDDGTQGTIDGGMVVTGTTDSSGQLTATFTKSEGAVGKTWVRAELLLEENGAVAVKQEDEVELLLDAGATLDGGLLMPFIRR